MWNWRVIGIGFSLMIVILLVTLFVITKTDVTTYEVPQFSSGCVGLVPALSPKDIVISFDKVMKAPVTLQQDDVRLIKHIQEKYLLDPSTADYNLQDPNNDDPSKGQSKQIRNILGDMVENGFFVDCGANDGEWVSNTLVFEKRFGWKGVLIEGDPKNIERLKKTNRKAHVVPACLSTKLYPNSVMFKQRNAQGQISDLSLNQHVRGYIEVQCLPFYSILLALNRTSVDYFSLDVEGLELQILQTIPWDKVNIKTLSVEHNRDRIEIRNFMEGKGYNVYTDKLSNKDMIANDFIFYRNDVTPKIPPPSQKIK